MAAQSSDTIQEGATLLAYSPSTQHYHSFTVQTGIPVRLWKYSNLDVGQAIGAMYGSRFIIQGNSIIPYKDVRIESEWMEAREASELEDKDNRHLSDTPTNQSLTNESIEEMKSEISDPQQLIGQIISNSNTFSGKTKFSQDKYIKRKKNRHLPEIILYKPNSRHLTLMYHHINPEKISYIRLDTLSLLLTYANVQSNTKLIVIDGTQGLMIGAVLERMGGRGVLIEVLLTQVPHPRTVLSSYTHLTQEHWNCLHQIPITVLLNLEHTTQNITETVATPTIGLSDNVELNLELPDNNIAVEEVNNSSDDVCQPSAVKPVTKTKEKKLEREKIYNETYKLLKEGPVDGLIITAKHNPLPLLQSVLSFVSPSRPIVVYSLYPELLTSSYTYLKQHSAVKMVEMSRSWLREYQIATGKIHPEMNTDNARTGVILTAITTTLSNNSNNNSNNSSNLDNENNSVKRIKTD